MAGPTTEQIEAAMSAFGEMTPDFRRYLEIREAGFVPIVRKLSYLDEKFSAELVFAKGSDHTSLNSDSPQFILWSLSHYWTMGSGFRLAFEMERQDELILPVDKISAIDVVVTCGLMKASTSDLHALTCIESAAQEGKRGYVVAIKHDVAKALTYVSSDPMLSITLQAGDTSLTLLRGYVDQVIPLEVQATGEKLVEVRGGDSLTGTRSIISGLYNSLVNFDTSLLFFSMYAEPAILLGNDHAIPELSNLDSFLKNGELTESRCEEFREWLREREKAGGSIGSLATEFLRVVSLEHPMYGTAPFSFRNLAILAHNQASLWMVIGSVQGLRVDGTLRIGHSVIVCEPESLHIWLKDHPRDEPLCNSWDADASLLITFFTADAASDTQDRGNLALQRAFDLLQLTISDSRFEHADGTGQQASLFVDGRLQDAVLSLSRWIHVHQIPTGSAHQYYCGRQRSSNWLEITDFQIDVIRQRLDVLTGLLNVPSASRPKSYAHVDHAISWFSRSRNSVTHSERFLCLWIGVEFLLIKTDDEAGREAIESGVTSRVARLMGGTDRTRRKYWQKQAEAAYRMRCDLVHCANDDHKRITDLIPHLEQAVFEVIWQCTTNLKQR